MAGDESDRESDEKKFARRLVSTLIVYEIPVNELCDCLSVEPQTVQNWCDGKEYPTFKQFFRMCNTYRIYPGYFFFHWRGDMRERFDEVAEEDKTEF